MAGTGGFSAPNAVNLITDPSQVNTPGMQSEINNVYTGGGQAQGTANNAAKAALQASGVGGGGEAASALGNIAGQTAGSEAQALAGLQNQQFQQQLQTMQAVNNAALENYNAQSLNNQGFNSQRQAMINGTGQSIGGLLGSAGTALGQYLNNGSSSGAPTNGGGTYGLSLTGNSAVANSNQPSLGNVGSMLGSLALLA